MSLLAIEDLSLAIHGLPILRDVAMAAAAGEVLGVIGESGSGKSMTALAVMGLLPQGAAARGRVLLDGARPACSGPRRRCARIRGRDIGMIFQEPMTALNPLQTIGDQVAETVRVHGRASRAEARAMARGDARAGRAAGGAVPARRAIRTSSRAGSGSGSASPWRSRSGRSC